MSKRKAAPTTRLHGSCVSLGSRGVLLFGKSGSGKSDLALRLLSRGAMLVADDQVTLHVEQGYLVASVHESIRGLLEIRGVGIAKYPVATRIPVMLAVNLVPREKMEHIPAPETYSALGINIPMISIHGYDASSPDKVIAAFRALVNNTLHTGFLPDDFAGISE